MNFLEVSKSYAMLTDPGRANEYDASISAIQSLMVVLTFGLLLSFGGVGFKKAYLAARSTSMRGMAARVTRSFGRSRGKSAAPSDAPRLSGVEVDADEETIDSSNPMHSGGPAAASKAAKGTRRDLAVEMTSFRSDKPAMPFKQGGRQLSVESSETMALPAPGATAAPSSSAPSSELPADWTEHISPTGDNYYHNSATGVTSWTSPAV